ncbi:MAG: hypothetical protein KKH98_06435, partial [Spirochaetes bacterium]|nr:hypothetical protein [Spirochaetota bacterium]
VSFEDIEEIIKEAKLELWTKFGATNLYFNYIGVKSLEPFFNDNLKTADELYKEMEKGKLPLFAKKIEYVPHKSQIIQFLNQWKLWDLKEFFDKETQEKIKKYEDVLPFLYDEYLNKLDKLRTLKTESGNYLIDRRNNLHNSYVNWKAAMNIQKDYDIIISNTLIVYDDYLYPYPHAVLRYAKVGGSSFESPQRNVFDGTTAMVNLFEMLTPLDYFKTEHAYKDIPRVYWNKIIGRYIMAHEMGHMIYLIPDVYDHPKGCLMDSSMENMDYVAGYEYLVKYPIECPKCQPYVTARNEHFAGDKLFQEKKYNEAIYVYKLALKMTPKKLDIDRDQYISLIEYKIARSYFELQDKKMTLFYLKNALQKNKDNEKAKDLLKKVGQ